MPSSEILEHGADHSYKGIPKFNGDRLKYKDYEDRTKIYLTGEYGDYITKMIIL